MELLNIVGDSSIKDKQALNELEKKIYIKSRKEGNKLKTDVLGVNHFLNNNDIKSFIKKVKKKLGCGDGSIKQEDGNTIIIFSGNHVESIKNIIIEQKITDISKIKF